MARFKEYRLVADWNEWRPTHPKDVYAITTIDGEFLFDVYEDEFIEMSDAEICSWEGDYHLLGNPTEHQMAEYAKKYGILWSDLENKN